MKELKLNINPEEVDCTDCDEIEKRIRIKRLARATADAIMQVFIDDPEYFKQIWKTLKKRPNQHTIPILIARAIEQEKYESAKVFQEHLKKAEESWI